MRLHHRTASRRLSAQRLPLFALLLGVVALAGRPAAADPPGPSCEGDGRYCELANSCEKQIFQETPALDGPKRRGVHAEGNTVEVLLTGQGFKPCQQVRLRSGGKSPIRWNVYIEQGPARADTTNACPAGAARRALLLSAQEVLLCGVEVSTPSLLSITVSAGDRASSPVQLYLSSTPRYHVLGLAAALLGGLVLLALGLLHDLRKGDRHRARELRGRPPQGDPDKGSPLRLLRALLLDRETDTYSLSRLQFLLWTGAVLFAYAHLFASRVLAQGELALPDIPDSLPGLIFVSASTSVAAAGFDRARKARGAVRQEARLSDLLSIGDGVAPDRLQFLVWTVVGVLGFLGLVVAADPAAVTTLPAVPSGLLWLMGTSSLGYIGGKLVRGPRPVLIRVEQVRKENAVQLTLYGRNLSRRATFFHEETPLDLKSVVIQEMEDGTDENMARILVLKVGRAAGDVELKGTLYLCNPDGQRSGWEIGPPQAPTPAPDSANAAAAAAATAASDTPATAASNTPATAASDTPAPEAAAPGTAEGDEGHCFRMAAALRAPKKP